MFVLVGLVDVGVELGYVSREVEIFMRERSFSWNIGVKEKYN